MDMAENEWHTRAKKTNRCPDQRSIIISTYVHILYLLIESGLHAIVRLESRTQITA